MLGVFSLNLSRYQLGQVNDWVALRRKVAAFNEVLSGSDGIRLAIPDNQSFHACYHKYYVFFEPEKLKDSWDRDRVMAEIHAGGALANLYGQ